MHVHINLDLLVEILRVCIHLQALKTIKISTRLAYNGWGLVRNNKMHNRFKKNLLSDIPTHLLGR